VYGAQKNVLQATVLMKEKESLWSERYLTREVSKAFYKVIYLQSLQKNYAYLDSLYSQYSRAASRRYEVGETNYLEKLFAESKQKELRLLREQTSENIKTAYQQLREWMQTENSLVIREDSLSQIPDTFRDPAHHPGLGYYQEALNQSQQTTQLEKQKLLPDLSLEWYRGTNAFPGTKIYNAFEAGLAIPLWFGAQSARIKASKLQTRILESEAKNYKLRLSSHENQLITSLGNYQKAILYYRENGQKLAAEIFSNAQFAFESGEINFLQFVQLVENARNIQISFLENLHGYNQTVLDLNYLLLPL